MDAITKIGEFRGIPVYYDKYMSEDEFRFARGPQFPDACYVGPAIYENGMMIRPDGTPLFKTGERISMETKFILTGGTMQDIKKNARILRKTMKEKYEE